MIQTPCIIFAGGKSSRMGEDKALLPFGSEPTLLEYQYKRLKQIFQNVYISCKNSALYCFDADFIEDEKEYEVYAPSIGFVSIFNRLHVNEIFVLSVDTPFVSESEICVLFKHKNDGYDAVIAAEEGVIHPLCGIYSRTLYPAFEKMVQNNTHKLSKLLHGSNTLFVKFHDNSNFLNLNHPSEYQEALLRLKQ